MELIAANALLTARHQERGLEPDMQRDVAALKNGSNADCELLAARVALLATDRWLASLAFHAREGARTAHQCRNAGR
jgi:hypothetical protein